MSNDTAINKRDIRTIRNALNRDILSKRMAYVMILRGGMKAKLKPERIADLLVALEDSDA